MNFGHFTCLSKSDVKLISIKESLWLNFSGTVKKFVKHLENIPCIRGKRYVQPSKMSFINLIIHSFSILAVFKYQVIFRSLVIIILLNFFQTYLGIFSTFLQFALIFFNILIILVGLREDEKELFNSQANLGIIEKITQ